MTIGSAIQSGPFIYVYDEQGRQVAVLPAGDSPRDGLQGYTSSTVNIRRGAFIYSYDSSGQQRSIVPAGS